MNKTWKAAFVSGYFGTLGVMTCVVLFRAFSLIADEILKKKEKKEPKTDK